MMAFRDVNALSDSNEEPEPLVTPSRAVARKSSTSSAEKLTRPRSCKVVPHAAARKNGLGPSLVQIVRRRIQGICRCATKGKNHKNCLLPLRNSSLFAQLVQYIRHLDKMDKIKVDKEARTFLLISICWLPWLLVCLLDFSQCPPLP